MASSYTEIYYLEYTGAVDNSGNGVRAQFDFQGYNRGASNLTAGRTWSVSMSNSDGPMCILMANNQEVSGVTAKILTSGTESGTTTGTLEMYPLTAGTTYRLQAYTEGGTPEVDLTFTPELNNNPRAKDLASGTLAESISASTTNLLVYVGNGSASTIKAVWPDTPFYATLMPASPNAGVPNNLDSEIVKVTAVGNDQIGNTTLTVVRGQKGTTTKAFSEGDVVTNAIYAGDAVLLSEEGTEETETPWVGTDDIEDGAITYEKIDTSTLKGEHFIVKSNSNGSFSLPPGYGIYHIRGIVNYTSCSANASMQIIMTNYLGTQWVRRILWEDNTPTAGEFSYDTGRLAILGTGARLATSSGSVAINLTVLARGGQIRSFCQFHHTGVRSSGISDMEGVVSDINAPIEVSFYSPGRTFNTSNIIVTGVRTA